MRRPWEIRNGDIGGREGIVWVKVVSALKRGVTECEERPASMVTLINRRRRTPKATRERGRMMVGKKAARGLKPTCLRVLWCEGKEKGPQGGGGGRDVASKIEGSRARGAKN